MGELVHTVLRTREGATAVAAYAPTAPAAGIPPLGPGAFIEDLYAAAVDLPRMGAALASFAAGFEGDLAWLIGQSGQDGLHVVERTAEDRTRLSLEAELQTVLAPAFGERAAEVHAGILSRSLGGDPHFYLAVVPGGQGPAKLGIVVLRHVQFTDADRQLARSLVPDMRRALQLRSRALKTDSFAVGRQMFENNPIAILVTRNRAIESKNAAAAAALAMRRPIGVTAGKLRFEDSRAQAAFELLSRAEHGQGRQTYAFVVEGAEGRTWIAQLSLTPPAGAMPATAPTVVVALTPFSGASQTREAMLRGFTELTATERAIFAAFVDGDDVAAIAVKMRRSVETVRWHVRNLFTKLGVNSQADLARLGALLLPL